MDGSEFRKKQRGVAAGMATALVIAFLAIAASLILGRGPSPAIAERLAAAARADMFVAVWLFAAIANVARLRFFSPHDIDGSGMTHAGESVSVANAVLQNTLEQVVLALAVHLALAAILPAPDLLIVTLVVLFSVGRACFWLGYRKGAAGRAFGFALTFYPTGLSLLLAIIAVLTGWRP